MLPEYGGTEVKLAEKEYVMFPLKICCSKCNPKSKKFKQLENFGCILEGYCLNKDLCSFR
jgi:hypothetical protein